MNIPFATSDATEFRGERFSVQVWNIGQSGIWQLFRSWLARQICRIWAFPVTRKHGWITPDVPAEYPKWFRYLALNISFFQQWELISPSFGKETKHVFRARDGDWYCRTTWTENKLREYNFDLRQILIDNALKDCMIPAEIFNQL